MNINDTPTRTLRAAPSGNAIEIIDQTALPHLYRTLRIDTLAGAAHAIRVMQVRGAPLIGVTAAYGVALAMQHDADDAALNDALQCLGATRPTAVNLPWALARMQSRLQSLPREQRAQAAPSRKSSEDQQPRQNCRSPSTIVPHPGHRGGSA